MNNLLYATSISIVRRMAMYILLALLFFIGTSKAQDNKDSIFVERAKMNYIKAMKAENESLRESAIFNVMALQQYYPGYNYNQIVETLHEISIEAENPKIRYKAFLAFNYFKNNAWFGKYEFISQQNPEPIFRSIANTINNRLLSLSQN